MDILLFFTILNVIRIEMHKIKSQIPNILSIVRIVLAFACFYHALSLNPTDIAISLGIFVIAAVTDFLDGYLARKWNITSSFGKILDPIADKILILGILFIFWYKGLVPLILTIIIAFREILLTAIRLILLPKKVVLASIQSGKFKTVAQISFVIIVYITLIFKSSIMQMISPDIMKYILLSLLFIVASITLYSGYEFFARNNKVLRKLSF